jgi:hypothetical protein
MRSSAGCWIGAHSARQFGVGMVVEGLDLVVIGLYGLGGDWL